MSILHAIVLGLTQGFSEFLPISSSGHLILVPWLLGWNDFSGNVALEKSFDVALHIGTLLAVCIYFARDIAKYLSAGAKAIAKRKVETDDQRVALFIALTAIPGAIVGALLDDLITKHLGKPWIIGLMLIVFAGVIYAADRRSGSREVHEIRARDALWLGAAQTLALQPGVSRSGMTISAARFSGFTRDSAARLSFLMSLPITGGAVAYKLAKLMSGDGIPTNAHTAFVVGIVASALSGLVAVGGLLRLIRTSSFTPFVVYRVMAGAGVLILAATSFR